MDKQRLTEAVTQYQSGDEAAFNTIYELTSSNLYVYAKSLMKDPHRAEDLLQNTYMQIIRNIGRLQAPGAFLTWSKRIMHNQYVDSVRGSHGETVATSEEALLMFDEVVEEDREALPEENYDVQQVGEIVWEVMEQMPPEQSMVMMAFYRDEMTVAEIAAMMDLPENTVKSRLFYGRKAMKAHLEDYERKHDIRLHSLVPGPIIGMALQNQVPAGYGLPFDQSMPLLHRILDSASQSAAHAAQGSASAGTAAAGLGGGKIAALVIAGALAAGGAGFGVHQAMTNQNDVPAEQTQTTETIQENSALNDADYPKLISGGLTKEETQQSIKVLTLGAMDDSIMSKEEINELNDWGRFIDSVYVRVSERGGLVDDKYLKFPLSDINRYRLFLGLEPAKANTTLEIKSGDRCWTDADSLYIDSSFFRGINGQFNFDVTEATREGDKLRISYNYSFFDGLNQTTEGEGAYTATFSKTAGGKFVLTEIKR